MTEFGNGSSFPETYSSQTPEPAELKTEKAKRYALEFSLGFFRCMRKRLVVPHWSADRQNRTAEQWNNVWRLASGGPAFQFRFRSVSAGPETVEGILNF